MDFLNEKLVVKIGPATSIFLKGLKFKASETKIYN